jgi:uncharacterized sulfatase
VTGERKNEPDAAGTNRRPNFVIIMTDTQGTNVVGSYGRRGRTGLDTPFIDRLAATGIRFDRGYTTTPLCTPARAGLFTGVYPHASGPIGNNIAPFDNMKTVGQRFQDLGYRTAYVGKWHLSGTDYFDSGVCPDGWDPDYWYDGRTYLADLGAEHAALRRGSLRTVDDLRRHGITAEFTWAHRVTDRGIGFLERWAQRPADQPFVLVLSYDEPHGPFVCPPEYAERFVDYRYPIGPGFGDSLADKPAHHREWATSSHGYHGAADHLVEPLYFGCNSFVDSEIGRAIEAIDTYAPEDTYIFYTSDHGDMLGAHRLMSKGPAMYEEIVNIPFIVRPPRTASLGASPVLGVVDSTPVSHIDILPTMLDLSGAAVPALLDGRSLVPLLDGHARDEARQVVVEFHRFAWQHDSWGGFQPIRCLIDGDYKLVLNLLDSDELYDLRHDPHELHNLIGDPGHTTVRDRLHDRLLDWMYERVDPYRGSAWERRPWRQTRRLTFDGGWTGQRRGRDDGYSPWLSSGLG